MVDAAAPRPRKAQTESASRLERKENIRRQTARPAFEGALGCRICGRSGSQRPFGKSGGLCFGSHYTPHRPARHRVLGLHAMESNHVEPHEVDLRGSGFSGNRNCRGSVLGGSRRTAVLFRRRRFFLRGRREFRFHRVHGHSIGRDCGGQYSRSTASSS